MNTEEPLLGSGQFSAEEIQGILDRYEKRVVEQPLDKKGEWFLENYQVSQWEGEFTQLLEHFELLLNNVPDYTGFVMAKHLLASCDRRSALAFQIARILLNQKSPLLVNYGLCLVIVGGSIFQTREITQPVHELKHSPDSETRKYAQLAEFVLTTRGF